LEVSVLALSKRAFVHCRIGGQLNLSLLVVGLSRYTLFLLSQCGHSQALRQHGHFVGPQRRRGLYIDASFSTE